MKPCMEDASWLVNICDGVAARYAGRGAAPAQGAAEALRVAQRSALWELQKLVPLRPQAASGGASVGGKRTFRGVPARACC